MNEEAWHYIEDKLKHEEETCNEKLQEDFDGNECCSSNDT